MTWLANGVAVFLALSVIILAVRKWSVVKDRRLILTVIRQALGDRKALLSGLAFAAAYLAVFMILGGKGGRLHLVFGRWIFNTTPAEILAGLLLAVVLAISMALFVYNLRVAGLRTSGRRGRWGACGALLAMLASFCP
jgi:hypothetical protein